MKKRAIAIIALSLTLLLLFTACTANQDWPSYNESLWTDNANISKTEDGYFYEDSIYRVHLDPDYKPDPILGENFPVYQEGAGTYISRIKWKPGELTTVETQFYFTMKLKVGTQVSDTMTDKIIASASFNSPEMNFFPQKSERTTLRTTFYSNTETEKQGFKQLDFKQTVNYDYSAKTASASLYAKGESGEYDTPLQRTPSMENSEEMMPTSFQFKGLANQMLFDNEMLYYGIRATSLDELNEIRKALVIVDIGSNKKVSLNLVENTNASKKTTIDLYNVQDNRVTDVKNSTIVVQTTSYKLTDGTATDNNVIKLWYSSLTPANGGKRYLMRMQQGQLIFSLQQVNGEFIQNDVSE